MGGGLVNPVARPQGVENNKRRVDMTKQDLINFEEDIKALFLDGKIRAPIHLSGGNEDALIDIFKNINSQDWVFSTHRSHLHALLHGIAASWLKSEILKGRSMHINSEAHKFMTSSIVGGCVPIAVGVAMAIKRRGNTNHVWVFVGDMAAEAGIFYECTKYAARQNLPISFVVEDNGMATNTPTQPTWGSTWTNPDIIKYSYTRGYPHINCGAFVEFK